MHFLDIWTSKSGPQFLTLLTWKCASRRNGVHFFDIWTSKSGPNPAVFYAFDLESCFAPQRRSLFEHFNFSKVLWTWCALQFFTWKRASLHKGVHFFDSWTSKSGPSMVCFVHFDLEMCFAPQRRGIFEDFNVQKWSERGVYCIFFLGNVLRAKTAHAFLTSQLLKVLRSWCALYILTWKRASLHKAAHFFDISTSKSGPKLTCFIHFDLDTRFAPQRRALFSTAQLLKSAPKLVCFVHFDFEICLAPQQRAIFISHLPRWLRTRHFSEASFRSPQTHKPLEKHSESRLSYLFAHLHLLSSHSFSSLLFSLLGFSSLTLPTSAFPSVHIVGSLASKLPSTIINIYAHEDYWQVHYIYI